MNTTTEKNIPKLQPPGAGLPLPQLLVVKFWYGAIVSKRTPRKESRATYERMTAKLIALASSLTPEQRATKVLVDPMPGLEDSSRFWSINGVLEHLMIVASGMERAILSLASGVVPDAVADTAKVKPKQSGEDWLKAFQDFAPGFLARIDEKLAQPGMNADSRLRFRHPWFGPITAHQWYWLAGSHQGLHYRQAKAIAKGLAKP
jgi:hypothetical protein